MQYSNKNGVVKMNKLTRAIIMAAKAHDGQVDNNGEPYIFHPLRVMRMGKTENEQICGVLHDAVEDGNVEYDVIHRNFGTEVMEALLALTHEKNTPYIDYIKSLHGKPLARMVKLNDLCDNLNGKRMEKLPRELRKRLIRKYADAFLELCNKNYAFNTIVHASYQNSKAECVEDFGEVLLENGYYKPRPEEI